MSNILRYAGFAEEAQFAQTPSQADFHIDIASSTLDTPTETQLVYEGGLGRGSRVHRPGFYSPSGNIVYAFDIKTIGFMLKMALGGQVITEQEGSTLTELYGSDRRMLPSFSARIGKDLFEHVFAGCVINSLELTVEEEFCEVSLEINGAKDEKQTIKGIADLKLTDAYPLSFHEITVKRDGVDISSKVKNLTLSIENNLSPEEGRGLGSRHPYRILTGERTITFSHDLFYEDLSALEKYWGGATGPSVNGSDELGVTITFDSGVYGSMDVKLPRVIYTAVSQQPSGRDEVVQAVEGKSFVDTITLENGNKVDTDIYVRLINTEEE